jgi:hypothetical protein
MASPPLGLIGPFLGVAPLGLVAGGFILQQAGHEALVAINTPRLVAVTHALVLGWVTTTMMGATYQLGPVVLGGYLLSIRLARVQFVVHAGALVSFVWALLEWNLVAMAIAGALLVLSLVLYLVNAGWAVTHGRGWSLPRLYLGVSLCFLAVAGSFGITYVGTLEHAWFPVTFGRLSAHAHLGLVGWLALTLMGVSYQLVPMFSVSNRVEPRFGTAALVVTGTAAVVFAAVMLTDPPMSARVPLAVALAAGPLLWSIDQWRTLRGRVRRRLDIQGRATMAGLAFLVLAAALGVGAAIGTPLTPGDEPARWPLAYGAAAIGGWAGTAVIGNSVKINAFLVWVHQYQPRIGTGPVPMVADLYSERLVTGVLAAHSLGTLLLVAGALAGELPLLHTGGLILALCGLVHFGCLAAMYIPRQERQGNEDRDRSKGGIRHERT